MCPVIHSNRISHHIIYGISSRFDITKHYFALSRHLGMRGKVAQPYFNRTSITRLFLVNKSVITQLCEISLSYRSRMLSRLFVLFPVNCSYYLIGVFEGFEDFWRHNCTYLPLFYLADLPARYLPARYLPVGRTCEFLRSWELLAIAPLPNR
jgi:hypothetical protein